MRTPKKHRATTAFSAKTVLKSCFFALLISVAAGVFTAALSAWLLLKATDPGRLALPVGMALSYLVALSCGFLATRFSRRRAPLLHGGVLGLLLLVLTLAALPLGKDAQVHAGLTAFLHVMLLPVACGGALLGAHQGRTPRHKKRYRA